MTNTYSRHRSTQRWYPIRKKLVKALVGVVGLIGLLAPISVQGQSPVPKRRTAVLLAELGPFGFVPDRISAPAGQYSLRIRGGAGAASGLTLLRILPNRSTESVRVLRFDKPERITGGELIDLTPGDYLLSDPSNPQRTLRITIGN